MIGINAQRRTESGQEWAKEIVNDWYEYNNVVECFAKI